MSTLTELTPAGLLGLGILMMMFGWLLPVRVVRGWMQDKDALIETQNEYIRTLEQVNAAALRGSELSTEALLRRACEDRGHE